MRTEVLSLRQTDGGAHATLKIEFGATDMGVFNKIATIPHPKEAFEDPEVMRICTEMIRSAFVGGWATFMSHALAEDADIYRRMAMQGTQIGPDDAILQDVPADGRDD